MYSKEIKVFIKRLLQKLRYEAKLGRDKIRVSRPMYRAAFLTGIARSTLFRIDKENITVECPQRKSEKIKKLDNFDLDVIERAIKAMFAQRICITLNKLKANLRDNFDIAVSKSTLWRAVRSKGTYTWFTWFTWFTWSMGRRHRTAGTAIVAQPSSAVTTATWLGRLSP